MTTKVVKIIAFAQSMCSKESFLEENSNEFTNLTHFPLPNLRLST